MSNGNYGDILALILAKEPESWKKELLKGIAHTEYKADELVAMKANLGLSWRGMNTLKRLEYNLYKLCETGPKL